MFLHIHASQSYSPPPPSMTPSLSAELTQLSPLPSSKTSLPSQIQASARSGRQRSVLPHDSPPRSRHQDILEDIGRGSLNWFASPDPGNRGPGFHPLCRDAPSGFREVCYRIDCGWEPSGSLAVTSFGSECCMFAGSSLLICSQGTARWASRPSPSHQTIRAHGGALFQPTWSCCKCSVELRFISGLFMLPGSLPMLYLTAFGLQFMSHAFTKSLNVPLVACRRAS